MSEKTKNAQAGDAAYGRALLCNRGGWTLREMLGSDYDEFSGTGETPFAQKDFQESLEKVSRRILSPPVTPKKRS